MRGPSRVTVLVLLAGVAAVPEPPEPPGRPAAGTLPRVAGEPTASRRPPPSVQDTGAPWRIPVPEGTPVHVIEPVPVAGRSARVELVPDLVIGDHDDPETGFYRPTDIAVAADGRIVVANGGAHRIQVYDDDGRHVQSMGREGEGPGELGDAGLRIGIVGDRVIVNDDTELSIWRLDGRHVADHRLRGPVEGRSYGDLWGAESHLVVRYGATGSVVDRVGVLTRIAPDGRELGRYATVVKRGADAWDPSMSTALWMLQAAVNLEGGAGLGAAVTRGDGVYVSPMDEYQVHRMTATGEAVWALRSPWPRLSYDEALQRRRMASLKERAPEATSDDVEWPERRRALAAVRVDGHGHLFVFPTAEIRPEDGEAEGSLDPSTSTPPRGSVSPPAS